MDFLLEWLELEDKLLDSFNFLADDQDSLLVIGSESLQSFDFDPKTLGLVELALDHDGDLLADLLLKFNLKLGNLVHKSTHLAKSILMIILNSLVLDIMIIDNGVDLLELRVDLISEEDGQLLLDGRVA